MSNIESVERGVDILADFEEVNQYPAVLFIAY